MTRRLFWPVILLITLLALSACKSGPQPKTAASNPDLDASGRLAAHVFMPLNLGNSWTYNREFLGEKGVFSVMIVSRDKEGFFLDDHGGRFMLTPFGLRDLDRYMLLSPLETGHRWRAQIAVNIAEHFEILDDAALVTVPAGAFERCLVVQSTTYTTESVRMITTTTYAPHVGMIRMETRLENNQGRQSRQFLLELTGYSFPENAQAPADAQAQEPTEGD
jgi:hypothetical protein